MLWSQEQGSNRMSIIRILHFEGLGFLYAALVMVGYKMLTGRINLKGLLSRKGRSAPNQTSPERIQLLLATIAAGTSYLGEITQSTNGKLPDISSNWLYLMAGSSGVYMLRKAWTTWKETAKLGG
jgi:hypothetical protein